MQNGTLLAAVDLGSNIFRLEIGLCHARREPDFKGLQLRSDWAANHPQSAHLLREEAVAWRKTPRARVLA